MAKAVRLPKSRTQIYILINVLTAACHLTTTLPAPESPNREMFVFGGGYVHTVPPFLTPALFFLDIRNLRSSMLSRRYFRYHYTTAQVTQPVLFEGVTSSLTALIHPAQRLHSKQISLR